MAKAKVEDTKETKDTKATKSEDKKSEDKKEELAVSDSATGGTVETENEEMKWGKAEPVSHHYVGVSLEDRDFTLDGSHYSGKDYYLVSVEGGRFFVVNKKFFNFFFKTYVK